MGKVRIIVLSLVLIVIIILALFVLDNKVRIAEQSLWHPVPGEMRIFYVGSVGVLGSKVKEGSDPRKPSFLIYRAPAVGSSFALVGKFKDVAAPARLSGQYSPAFAPRHLIFVWGRELGNDYRLYVSSDGGLSWQRVPVPGPRMHFVPIWLLPTNGI